MTDYYISSLNGSDANTGASFDQAWASFDILDSISLEAGDHIYLEAGSFFNDTLYLVDAYGELDKPITVSSYGTGNPALITSDTGSAILASRTSNILIENITVGHTVIAGIEGMHSDSWTVRNVTFDEAGGEANNFGAFNWQDSANLIFENNTILSSYGDGMFLNEVENILISQNYFYEVQGSDADNVQVIGDNVVIENNVMIAGTNDSSYKGNVVFEGENFYVADNYLQGGSFGVSASADQVVIEDNILTGHDRYSWSAGVLISDERTGDLFQGLSITNNQFDGAPNGISIYGAAETVNSSDILTITNLDISGNEFFNWDNKAVKFTNTDLYGAYRDNLFYQVYDEYWSNSYAKTTTEGLIQENNVYVAAENLAVAELELLPKTVTITASGDPFKGAPKMEVWHNEELVFQADVMALKSKSQKQTFSFDLYDYDVSDKLSFKFTNDKLTYNYHISGDRNLYIHDVKVDDHNVSLYDVNVEGKVFHLKKKGILFFSGVGEASFNGEDLGFDQKEYAEPVKEPLDIHDVLDLEEYLFAQSEDGHQIGAGHEEVAIASDFSYTTETLNDVFVDVL